MRALPTPERLILPLESERFSFSDVRVEDGRRVRAGQILAVDPAAYSIPLLAPLGGIVRLSKSDGHMILEDLDASREGPAIDDGPADVDAGRRPAGETVSELVRLGAWQFFEDAHTGLPVDPQATPSAVIVSTIHLEPFVARGDVQLFGRLDTFARGLQHIQSLLEYQPIHLVLPNIDTPFAREVRESLRGHAWIRPVSVPLRYPYDDLAILARHLGIRRDPGSLVWGVPTAGVFAVDRALSLSRPVTERVIAVGGPAIGDPVHVRTVPGHPVSEILADRACGGNARVLSGGVLTGSAVEPGETGLDAECRGLTVLGELSRRHLFAFARPGISRRSYGRTFLSVLCPGPPECLRTGLSGELRPCIACGQCVDVCPAGILPNFIHKYVYQDDLEQVQRLRVDLCVECGLCSYVCPSKIELREEIIEAKRTIREELEILQEIEA